MQEQQKAHQRPGTGLATRWPRRTHAWFFRFERGVLADDQAGFSHGPERLLRGAITGIGIAQELLGADYEQQLTFSQTVFRQLQNQNRTAKFCTIPLTRMDKGFEHFFSL